MYRSVCSRQASFLTKSLENHTGESSSLINSDKKKKKVGHISPDWSPTTKSRPRRSFTLCNFRLCIKLFRSQLNHILNHFSVHRTIKRACWKSRFVDPSSATSSHESRFYWNFRDVHYIQPRILLLLLLLFYYYFFLFLSPDVRLERERRHVRGASYLQ